MTQVSGITIERAQTGHPTYIKFEYNKYVGLLQRFLQEHDIEIPLLPNDVTKAAMKEAQNYKKFERFDSAESLLADCLKD
jgi:patatin-like phospholipase/acyl hydrolase